jgi:ketosteroid isomerase-like protein
MITNRLGGFAVTGPLILSLIACGSPDGQRPDVSAITSEVEAAVGSFFQAMNAHDGDAVIGHYVGPENFLYAGITNVAVDWETWSGQVQAWYRANSDVEFTHELMSIQVVAPTVAVATVRGSSSEAEALLWTQVWAKDAETGRWLITTEHESWPECVDPPRPHVGTNGE